MAAVNAYRLWTEHWEHKSHEPPLEEQVEYPYMNIRTKSFFWGDGDKVRSSLYFRTRESRTLGRLRPDEATWCVG